MAIEHLLPLAGSCVPDRDEIGLGIGPNSQMLTVWGEGQGEHVGCASGDRGDGFAGFDGLHAGIRPPTGCRHLFAIGRDGDGFQRESTVKRFRVTRAKIAEAAPFPVA